MTFEGHAFVSGDLPANIAKSLVSRQKGDGLLRSLLTPANQYSTMASEWTESIATSVSAMERSAHTMHDRCRLCLRSELVSSVLASCACGCVFLRHSAPRFLYGGEDAPQANAIAVAEAEVLDTQKQYAEAEASFQAASKAFTEFQAAHSQRNTALTQEDAELRKWVMEHQRLTLAVANSRKRAADLEKVIDNTREKQSVHSADKTAAPRAHLRCTHMLIPFPALSHRCSFSVSELSSTISPSPRSRKSSCCLNCTPTSSIPLVLMTSPLRSCWRRPRSWWWSTSSCRSIR